MSKVGTASKQELTLANKELSKVFYSNEFLMGSFPKFWDTIKDMGIPYRVARNWYENQEIVQLFKPIRKPQKEYSIRTTKPLKVLYMDTMSIDEYYLVNTIDLFTKYASSSVFRKPVTAEDSVKALKEFLKSADLKLDNIEEVRCDGGTEYAGAFKQYIGEKKITSLPYRKSEMSPIERFNGTMRRILEKLKSYAGKPISWAYKYVPKAVKAYNDAVHSTTKYAPSELLKSKEAQDEVMSKRYKKAKMQNDNALQKGDTVRIVARDMTNVFDRKIRPNWSQELFKIEHVRGNRVTLDNMQTYKGHEVQKIDPDLLFVKRLKVVNNPDRKQVKTFKKVAQELKQLDNPDIQTEKRVRKPNPKYI